MVKPPSGQHLAHQEASELLLQGWASCNSPHKPPGSLLPSLQANAAQTAQCIVLQRPTAAATLVMHDMLTLIAGQRYDHVAM